MTLSNFDNPVVEQAQEGNDMSAAVAADYVAKMVHSEARCAGDTEGALRRLEARYGIPYWTMVHLKRHAAKTVAADMFQRIRSAYLDICERQVRRMSEEIAILKAANTDDSIEDLAAEATRLAAQVAAAKAKRTRE